MGVSEGYFQPYFKYTGRNISSHIFQIFREYFSSIVNMALSVCSPDIHYTRPVHTKGERSDLSDYTGNTTFLGWISFAGTVMYFGLQPSVYFRVFTVAIWSDLQNNRTKYFNINQNLLLRVSKTFQHRCRFWQKSDGCKPKYAAVRANPVLVPCPCTAAQSDILNVK